jgi:FkbM family methyltransferase
MSAEKAERTMNSEIGQRLERSLALNVETVMRFEQRYLETKLSAGWQSSLLLFGAGQLGLRALAGLRRLGIEPLAFVDNQPSKWNGTFGGLPILSSAESLRRFGTSTSFIVCIWRSKAVMNQLASLGCRSAAEFKALFWRFPDEFLPNMRVDRPHLILQQARAVHDVFNALSDDASRVEYVQQIEWLLKYDFDPLEVATHSEQYFEKQLFMTHPREVFVDCGAFTGDTLQAFLRHYPEPRALHAFEPEPANLAALLDWRNHQSEELRDRVFVHPFAASDRRQRLRFNADGVGSAVDRFGSIEVETITLDEVLANEAVTFIKMDIEGGEPDAIDGATQLIARCRPVIAVCLYHRQEHLFTIPNKLREIYDGYKLFIRRYGDQFGDIVCYAVPPERTVSHAEGCLR